MNNQYTGIAKVFKAHSLGHDGVGDVGGVGLRETEHVEHDVGLGFVCGGVEVLVVPFVHEL